MNRFLADLTGALNAVVGLCLILVGAALGAYSPSPNPLGLFLGALVGLLLAAVLCGFVAQLADMRRLLKEIRDQGKRPIHPPQQTPQDLAAQDMEKIRKVLPRLP